MLQHVVFGPGLRFFPSVKKRLPDRALSAEFQIIFSGASGDILKYK